MEDGKEREKEGGELALREEEFISFIVAIPCM